MEDAAGAKVGVGEVAEAEAAAAAAAHVEEEAVAGEEMDPIERLVTFDDVCLYFSREEWELLDDSQRALYCSVMLQNFVLVLSLGLPFSRRHIISQLQPQRAPREPNSEPMEPEREPGVEVIQGRSGPDCSYAVEDENTSEHGSNVSVPRIRTLIVGPCAQKDHPCDRCDLIFREILNLSAQQGLSAWEQPHSCSSCGRLFWVSAHSDYILKQQNVQTISRKEEGHASANSRLPCRDGGDNLLAISGLDQDQAIQHGETSHQSAECKETFLTGHTYYSCSDCGKVFSHKDRLVQHRKTHREEKPYECSSESGTVSNYSSSIFIKTHSKELPSVLDNDKNSIDPNLSFIGSESFHAGSRPYDCTECGKSFTRKFHLIQHQKIHAGAKPYECSECGKSFCRKDSLAQHQKIHSGEKPCMCSSCGKTFVRKDALVEHERSHTGERSYVCDECGKMFSHSSYVKIHKRIHSGTRPYACNDCGKTYITHPHLIQHQKTHTVIHCVGGANLQNSLAATPASPSRVTTLDQDLVCPVDVGKPKEDTPTDLGP